MRDVPQLKVVREEQGWSQRDLAARSGVAQNTISQLERGERKAMPSTIRKLADALGVEPSDLLANPLTSREREVLRLIAHGYNNRQIVEELSIGQGTFEHIMTRLQSATLIENREIQAQEESHESGSWAERYVSGKFVEVSEAFSPEQKDAILSRERDKYLKWRSHALLSYNEDLFVAGSRLESNDPKETIEAAQLVLSRAWKILEEYDSKLQSFHRIPEHYYADPAAYSHIMKLQEALSEQREAAADAVRELMNLYNESLDTLETQILGMRKESDVLEAFVTQAHDQER